MKVSAAVRWLILDPVAYTAVTDAEAVVYLAVQIALRDELAVREAMDVVRSGRSEVAPALLAAARLAGASVGVSVDDVVIKDIVLPAELRAAYAELVAARQRGQVQLGGCSGGERRSAVDGQRGQAAGRAPGAGSAAGWSRRRRTGASWSWSVGARPEA